MAVGGSLKTRIRCDFMWSTHCFTSFTVFTCLPLLYFFTAT